MTRAELLKSSEYWEEVFTDSFFQSLKDYLKENKLKKKDLAQKMGVNRSHVSQILNAETDHRLSKFIKLALAMDKVPYVYLKDVQQIIEEDAAGESIHMDFKEMEQSHNRCKILKRKRFKLPTKVQSRSSSFFFRQQTQEFLNKSKATEDWSQSGITIDVDTSIEHNSISKAS